MDSSQCGDQHAHVLGFVSKVRTLKLFLCQVRDLIHSKRVREILLVKPSAPLDQEELESDGQTAYHSVSARLANLASDRSGIAFACKECSRAIGKATRADLTRLKRIGRYLLYTPRAVWEFPLQQEENIVLIDGLSDADAAGCPNTRRSTSGRCLRVGQHTLATWSSTQKVVSLSSAESEYYSMGRCASEANGLANTIRELGHEAQVRIWTDCCSASRTGSPKRERRNQTRGDEVLLAAAEREKPRAQDREDPRHGQSRRLVDGKRLVTLCELLNIKRLDGRPTSAPKLTIDTEYISRASRALAAVTQVKRATASELAVHSGAMQGTWIDGYRAGGRTVTGWIAKMTANDNLFS